MQAILLLLEILKNSHKSESKWHEAIQAFLQFSGVWELPHSIDMLSLDYESKLLLSLIAFFDWLIASFSFVPFFPWPTYW